MIYRFVCNAFMKWLAINNHRFNNLPCNIQQENNFITFNLSGITQLLRWEISKTGAFLISGTMAFGNFLKMVVAKDLSSAKIYIKPSIIEIVIISLFNILLSLLRYFNCMIKFVGFIST